MEHEHPTLVLGATGGIGGEVARQLRDAGWPVRALSRGAPPAEAGLSWVRGDALNTADVMAAAQGCRVIVHAVNPPGYRHWADWVLPMLENTLAAARAQQALVVLPGTLYNHGPDAGALLGEAAPQHPLTRKGAIRVAMEQRLQDFAAAGGRVLIVRAGDFFGPRCGNSWFAQGLVQPGRPITQVRQPGRAGVGHQWAYLPDVARSIVALLARRHTLDPFARFHLGGHWDADGTQMVQSIVRVVGRRSGRLPRVRAFPWWQVRLAAPFVPTLRELLEMRYLWERPVQLDNQALRTLLGTEPHTPWDAAVEATLEGLGCLPAPAVVPPLAA